MDHVGAAILFAQAIVDRAGVKYHGSAVADRVGGLQQRIRGEIGNDETDVAIGECNRRLGCVVAVLQPNLFQGEVLIEEFAGGVVVLDREAGARQAVVFGRLLDQRQCRLDTAAMKIADADFDRILGSIEEASGRKVQATRKVDTDLIGGIVLQAGSMRLDASVRGRLERLRQNLATTRS